MTLLVHLVHLSDVLTRVLCPPKKKKNDLHSRSVSGVMQVMITDVYYGCNDQPGAFQMIWLITVRGKMS